MKIKMTKDYKSNKVPFFEVKNEEECEVIGILDKEYYYIVEDYKITNKMVPKVFCDIVDKSSFKLKSCAN